MHNFCYANSGMQQRRQSFTFQRNYVNYCTRQSSLEAFSISDDVNDEIQIAAVSFSGREALLWPAWR